MKTFFVVVFVGVFLQVAYNKEAANDEPDPDTINSGETLSQNSPVFEIYEKISPDKVYKNYNSYGKIKELNKYLATQLKGKEEKPANMNKSKEPGKLVTGSFNFTSSFPTSNITNQEISNNNSISKRLPKASETSADDEDDDFNRELLSDSGLGEGDDQGSILIPKIKNKASNSNDKFIETTMSNTKATSDFIAEINSGSKFNQLNSSNNIKTKYYNNTIYKKESSNNNASEAAKNKLNTVSKGSQINRIGDESKIDRIKALLKISYKPLNEQVSSNKIKEENKPLEKNDKKSKHKTESIIQPHKQWIIRILQNNNTNASYGQLTKFSTGVLGSGRWAINKQHRLDASNFTSSGSGAEADYDGNFNDEEDNSELIKTSKLNPNLAKSDLIIIQENSKDLGHNEEIDKNMIFPESNFLNEIYKNGYNVRKKEYKKKDKKHKHIKIYPIKSHSYTNHTESSTEEQSISNIQELRLKKMNTKKKKEDHDPEFNLLNLEIVKQANQKRKKFQENVGNIVHNKLFNDTLFEVAGQKEKEKHRKKQKKQEGLVFVTNTRPKNLNDYEDDNNKNVDTDDEAYLYNHDMHRRNVDALMIHRRGEIELRRSLKKKGNADWLRKYWGGESEENGGDISLILKKRSEIMQDEVGVYSGIGSNLGYEDKFINKTLVTEQILSDMNLGESAVEQNEKKEKEFDLQEPSLATKDSESVLKTDGLKAKENIDRPRHYHYHKKSQKDTLVRGKRDTVLDQLKEHKDGIERSTAVLPFNNIEYTGANREYTSSSRKDTGLNRKDTDAKYFIKNSSPHIKELKQYTEIKSSVKKNTLKERSKINKKNRKPVYRSPNRTELNRTTNVKKHVRTKRSDHKLKIIPSQKIALLIKKSLTNTSSVLGNKRLNIPFDETVKTDLNNIGITDLYNMDKMSRLRSAPFFGNEYDVWNPEEANSISKLFASHPSDGGAPDVNNNKVTSTAINGIISPAFYQPPTLTIEPSKVLTISSAPSSIPDYEKISSDELEGYVKDLKEEKKKEAQLAQEGKAELNLEGKVDLNLELNKSIREMLNMVKSNSSKNKTKLNLLVHNEKPIDKINEKGQNTIEPIDSSVATVDSQSNMLKNSKQALQQDESLKTNLKKFKNQFIDNLYSKALSDSDEIKNLQEHTYRASTSPLQAKALNDQISEFTQTKAEKSFREMEMGRVENELQIRNQYATSFPMFSYFDEVLKTTNEEGASKKHTTTNDNVKKKTSKKTFSNHLKHSRHLLNQTKKKTKNKLKKSSHDLIRHFIRVKEPFSKVSNEISLHKGENEDEPLSKRVDIKNAKIVGNENKLSVENEEKIYDSNKERSTSSNKLN